MYPNPNTLYREIMRLWIVRLVFFFFFIGVLSNRAERRCTRNVENGHRLHIYIGPAQFDSIRKLCMHLERVMGEKKSIGHELDYTWKSITCILYAVGVFEFQFFFSTFSPFRADWRPGGSGASKCVDSRRVRADIICIENEQIHWQWLGWGESNGKRENGTAKLHFSNW